ncbi:unnamed protein product [Brassica oleracea var. botrytis]|uniref:Uncharacterized protein n=2 Tax=Brassica oleracea TaxID=3712 RepID=A0A0D3BKS2_BRAOL|nr:unnamed protein product [Brassica oleracea]
MFTISPFTQLLSKRKADLVLSSFISLVVLGRRGEVTACLMAVKFPDWWSVLARGERCLRLMGKDEFFLVEEAVCSVVFAVVRGHRERVVQMRIPALDEETPCFVCLLA